MAAEPVDLVQQLGPGEFFQTVAAFWALIIFVYLLGLAAGFFRRGMS